MFVQVDLLYGESEQGTLIPASALWEDPATGVITAFVVQSAKDRAPSASNTAEVRKREITVIGEGRAAAAVSGVQPGERVVVIGQHMFEGDGGQARVRSTTWERVAALQSLQREDLLEDYLARQQRLAKALGSRPFTNEEFLGATPREDSRLPKPAGGGV
jgi:hypothetical protein